MKQLGSFSTVLSLADPPDFNKNEPLEDRRTSDQKKNEDDLPKESIDKE